MASARYANEYLSGLLHGFSLFRKIVVGWVSRDGNITAPAKRGGEQNMLLTKKNAESSYERDLHRRQG